MFVESRMTQRIVGKHQNRKTNKNGENPRYYKDENANSDEWKYFCLYVCVDINMLWSTVVVNERWLGGKQTRSKNQIKPMVKPISVETVKNSLIKSKIKTKGK